MTDIAGPTPVPDTAFIMSALADFMARVGPAGSIRGLALLAGSIAASNYPGNQELPELVITGDAEGDSTAHCPYCQTGTDCVVAVDQAERWTTSTTLDQDELLAHFTYDGHGDYSGLHYQTGCCGNPVRLPDGWGEVP